MSNAVPEYARMSLIFDDIVDNPTKPQNNEKYKEEVLVLGRKKESSWVGWIYFASALLAVSGGLNIIAGLTGIFHSDYYVATQSGKLLMLDYSAWGWTHLILGAAMLALGVFLYRGKTWAGVVTIGVAVLSMIVNLAFIGTYPLWAVIALILNSCVIYAISLHGDEIRNRQ